MAEKFARRPLMAGNWKMNLNHLEAIALVQKLAFSLSEQQLTDVEAVVLPPFTDLRSVQTLVDGDKLLIGYGAQDLSPHKSGAYTGDISGPMLAKLGCQYVVVGHSERRAYHAEDDAVVNAKVKAALANDIAPILCVGEGLDVREAQGHVAHCRAQLDAALAGLKADQVEKVVVAYEPVWAIGTGKTATPEDAQEVCGALRERLAETYGQATADRVRILYGGSVKAANIAGIMAQPDVDGALVGGASLDAEEFAQICRFPEHIARRPAGCTPAPDLPLSLASPRFERTDRHMPIWFAYTLIVLLIITSILLTLLILLHRGKGGGLSSMFGGGVSSSLAGSSVAEKNLDRYTILVGIVWFASIVGLGLWLKLAMNAGA